jgi:hypothetical protein
MSGSQAAKALRQLSKESKQVAMPVEELNEENRGDGPVDEGMFSGPESPTDRFMALQTHQQKILARLARKEAEAHAQVQKKRNAMMQRRKIKVQNDLFNKMTYEHENPQYYEYLPMKPGIDAYKWLAPVREHVVAGKKHHRPGLDAVKLNMPDTIIYSDRYAGVAETWLSTSTYDGCVISRRLTGKWIGRCVQRACYALDNTPGGCKSTTDFGLRRPVSVLKISHWRRSESRNITRVIPEYSLAEALKAPTPTPGAVCIQNFAHSRGAHSSCYRVVWNAYKPATGFLISSEKSYGEKEPSTVATGSKHKGSLVDDFLSSTHLASIENRSDDMMLPVTVFELNGKAIEEPIAITKRIAQYLERAKTESGCMKFDTMVCDFVKSSDGKKDHWIFLQIKAFRVSASCWTRCKKMGLSRHVSVLLFNEICVELLWLLWLFWLWLL